MGCDGKGTGQGALRVQEVRGEPYHVGGRVLIPEARLVSFGKASATIGSDRIGGWAGGFTKVIPVAIVEVTDEGERRLAIRDATAAALWGLFAAATAITLLFTAIRWLARRRRGAGVNP